MIACSKVFLLSILSVVKLKRCARVILNSIHNDTRKFFNFQNTHNLILPAFISEIDLILQDKNILTRVVRTCPYSWSPKELENKLMCGPRFLKLFEIRLLLTIPAQLRPTLKKITYNNRKHIVHLQLKCH